MFDHKKKSLQDIMKWADSKAYGGLKKRGEPDAMPAAADDDAPVNTPMESTDAPADPELTPEIIAALEELLAKQSAE